MTCKEQQEEELEVLRSIYYGDECFKELSPVCFQYKVGENEDSKSFLLEITWGESYPNCVPEMNLNAFYNKNILPEVKDEIISKLRAEAELQLGTAMTYTILEWAKEHAAELMEAQPLQSQPLTACVAAEEKTVANGQAVQAVKEEKKPKLSKQQKRRLYDRLDARGERPRGWNWVDVVKHLSQMGPKQPAENEASSFS